MPAATTTGLPFNLWRAMNLICRDVTGAVARPSRPFVQSGAIAAEHLARLDELELIETLNSGLQVVAVAMPNTAEQRARIYTDPDILILIRATAAGNRWVGENSYNRVLTAVRRLDRGNGVVARDVLRSVGDEHLDTVLELIDDGLLEVPPVRGVQLRPGRVSREWPVRLTGKAHGILAT